ncbi:MAG: alpha/beta fold hydrolase [Solirubrobacterales bacterium]|nr:alpha/beta fold hydrolase [Solirubrobacterales bacterium]MCB8971119.1 alpha/beta fold hydrolase [Thermoleophilales bacterium]MCO5327882.1 alpha/beta fold hydrolase [Solirubrobacterales bacterium]
MNPVAPRSRASLVALALVCAAALLALLAGPAIAKKPSKPVKGPAGAKFYTPPKHYPSKHGSLIWQRKATGITPLPGAKNKLVLYTTRTLGGGKVVASGIVSVPKGKAPKGGWPVISYAHGTTGVADVCAPTRAPAGSPQEPYVTYVNPQLQDWIDAGYAVVRTDFAGLGTPGPHGYLVGIDEGHAVLDIVTAARTLNRDLGKKFLIAGHSQGGHAALFAAAEAAKYGKGLKLRGTVAYAPASHIAEQESLLPALTSPSGLTALATLIVSGASTVSDQIQPSQVLSDQVLQFYPQVDETCLPQLSASDSLGGIPPSQLERPGADLTALRDVLQDQNPAIVTKAPILLAQGLADTTVFPFLTNSLNDELVAKGNQVDYQTYPDVDHSQVVAAAEDQAMAFFEQRLPSGK